MSNRLRKRRGGKRRLGCERLESRCVLSALVGAADDVHAVIVAGDPNGTLSDSPAERVDLNSNMAFAGVGSLQISARNGTYICTGTAIDATHVLTAGHCVDFNDDGRSDSRDGINSITFNVNSDVDASIDVVDVAISAASWSTNSNFTGFARPAVNDDLAVIRLASALPPSVPTYALAATDLTAGTTIVMVGYGRSGDGVSGYTTGASFTVKRVGENVVDAFYGQDDGGQVAANEVFRFDFDGPSGSGPLGGGTLGNDRETTLGGGDSGGPSFVRVGSDATLASSYVLVGVNTFTQGTNAPRFGSMGGGINVFPYKEWIQGGGSGGGGSSKGRGGPKAARVLDVFEIADFASAGAESHALNFTVVATSEVSAAAGAESGRTILSESRTVTAWRPADGVASRLQHLRADDSLGATGAALDREFDPDGQTDEEDLLAVDAVFVHWI